MAFIKINDWQVSISKGGEFRPKIIGTRGNAYDGTILRMRRGWKRRWSFTTTGLDTRDAEGLIGMIAGRGEHWQYDYPWQSDNATVGTRFESTKGLVPTGTVSATVVPGYDLQGTYPARVYEESSGEPESKFGAGALKVEPATENILPADARDCEDSTAFTAYLSATLADETTIRVQGSKGLKITTSSTAFSGAYVAGASVSATTTYTGSAYVYTTEALTLRLSLNDGATNTFTGWTTTPNVWERVEVTHTTGLSPSYIRLFLLQPAATAGKLIYSDMWQIEETDYATAWADGTRAAGVLRYDLNPIPRALTIAMWVKAPSANPTGTGYLWILRGPTTAANGFLWARRDAATNNIAFAWDPGDGAPDSINYGTNPWDGDWHHTAFVYMPNDGGTEGFYMYFDGSLVASDTSPATVPRLVDTSSNRFYPGSQAGTQHWIGAMDEILVLPYPMSAGQIAALAARTRALPPYPRLELTGDFQYSHLDSRGLEAEGVGQPSAEYEGRVDSGSFKEYFRRVSFEMQSTKDV